MPSVLVVVVLVLMVAMIAMEVVEVPTVRQSLVPAVGAVNVHVSGVQRVDISLAIRGLLPRLVVDGWSSGGCVRLSIHDLIICFCVRDGQVVEDFAA
jgi:hypothetical protein